MRPFYLLVSRRAHFSEHPTQTFYSVYLAEEIGRILSVAEEEGKEGRKEAESTNLSCPSSMFAMIPDAAAMPSCARGRAGGMQRAHFLAYRVSLGVRVVAVAVGRSPSLVAVSPSSPLRIADLAVQREKGWTGKTRKG